MSNHAISENGELLDPALIPRTILENHRRENRARGQRQGLYSLIAYNRRIEHTPHTSIDGIVWRIMLDNGLTSALITCMLDGHACGFSKTELTSWQETGLDLYCTNILVRCVWTVCNAIQVVNHPPHDSLTSPCSSVASPPWLRFC